MRYDIDKLTKYKEFIQNRINIKPLIGVILGSGLGNFAEYITVVDEILYSELEQFPVSTVDGHEGKFIFGYMKKVPVVCMKGRIHYYEGYSIDEVVMPVLLMSILEIKILLLTNAAGGIQKGMKIGDFMLITDHVSLFSPNPLIGPNSLTLGTRFPDMSQVYDQELSDIIRNKFKKAKLNLKEGVYVQLTGPSFETPAEIQLLGKLGCDAVGMSTVVEAITAKYRGIRICGISLISNLAAGISETALSYEDVNNLSEITKDKFSKVILDIIQSFYPIVV